MQMTHYILDNNTISEMPSRVKLLHYRKSEGKRKYK